MVSRGTTPEADEQLAGSRADVAGDCQCLAYQLVCLVADAGAVAVQGSGQSVFGVVCDHRDGWVICLVSVSRGGMSGARVPSGMRAGMAAATARASYQSA